MARVLTNNTSLQYAIETTFGVLPGSPVWKLMEPNSISSFGADITTVPRNPISRNRQASKGTVTDLDSSVEHEADITVDSFLDFVEGFAYATAKGGEFIVSGALSNNLSSDDALTVAGTPPGYAHDALTAVIAENTLVYGRGFTPGALSNGLHGVGPSGSVTETPVTGAPVFVIEAPSNEANASLELAGFRFSDLTWDDTAKQIGSAGVDLTTIGLSLGQCVHVGGLVAGTQFTNGLIFGRVTAITAALVTLDKITNVGVGTLDGGGNETADDVDLLFGKFISNVPVGTAGATALIGPNLGAFIERSYQIEAEFPDLLGAGLSGFEYALGNFANQLAWSLPLTDKSTATFGFVGTDAEPPVGVGSRKTNAATPRGPVATTAFNTSSDFIRIRVQKADQSGLTTFFKGITFTMNNNVSPEKTLGNLGATFMNFGNLDVTLEGNVLFTNGDVIAAIRNNETVTFDFIVRNDNGGIAVDIPSMTLGGGAREYPVNETVQVALTGTAFVDPMFDTSVGISLFPVLPTT